MGIIQQVIRFASSLVLSETDTIARLDAQTAKETTKAEHLTAVLNAKKRMLEARSKAKGIEIQISVLGKDVLGKEQGVND